MNKILKIARREYRASVRTKGFIIGLAVAPILMSGSIIAMALFRGKVDTTDKHIVVVDHSGIVVEEVVRAAEARNSVVGVEDSGAGVCAIRLAGFPTIGVSGGNVVESGTRALCEFYCESFEEALAVIGQSPRASHQTW